MNIWVSIQGKKSRIPLLMFVLSEAAQMGELVISVSPQKLSKVIE